jgi:hypothetical protein
MRKIALLLLTCGLDKAILPPLLQESSQKTITLCFESLINLIKLG